MEVDQETPLAHGETGVVTEMLYVELGGAEGLKRGDKLHASCVVLQTEGEEVSKVTGVREQGTFIMQKSTAKPLTKFADIHLQSKL